MYRSIYNSIQLQYTRQFNCTQKLNCIPIYKAIKLQSTQLYTSKYKSIQLYTSIYKTTTATTVAVVLFTCHLTICQAIAFGNCSTCYCLPIACCWHQYLLDIVCIQVKPIQCLINCHLAVVIANHVGHWARCIGYQFQYLLYSLALLVLWQI